MNSDGTPTGRVFNLGEYVERQPARTAEVERRVPN